MSFGPVELLMVAFPDNTVGGGVTGELRSLVDAGTIRIVDGVFVTKDDDGVLTFHELDQPGVDTELAPLRELITHPVDLVSGEDIEDLAVELEAGASAALMAVEYVWAKALSEAVQQSGGRLVADVLIPAPVVNEVAAAASSS